MTTLSGARHEANIVIRGHKSTGETPIHENRRRVFFIDAS